MKRKDQYEDSARFFVIAVVGLILLAFVLVISAAAQPDQTGYLIVHQTFKPHKTTVVKTTSATQADSVLKAHAHHLINVEKAFEQSNYLIVERENMKLYAEKKRAVYTRMGKLKLKKIRK